MTPHLDNLLYPGLKGKHSAMPGCWENNYNN